MAKGYTGIITQYNGYKPVTSVLSSDYQDSGSDYASFIRTRDMNFGDPFGFKHGSHYEIIFDKSFANDVDVSIQRETDTGDISSEPNLNVASYSIQNCTSILPWFCLFFCCFACLGCLLFFWIWVCLS